MTNEQQQIEVWTEQFENWAYDYPGSPLDKKYLLQAWIAAKRTMPVIEMPNNQEINHLAVDIAGEYDWNTLEAKEKYIKSFTDGALVACDSIYRSLTAAGCQYKIKGE
jgi:hypothetical protein